MYLSKQMTKSGFSSKIGRIPTRSILGDPGADSGDEEKSKRAGKYGTKKSKERREEPLGTMSYQTSFKRSPPFLLLIGSRTAATVWNWSGKTLFPGALSRRSLLFFVPYFPARLDFPSPPLSAPGSPTMNEIGMVGQSAIGFSEPRINRSIIHCICLL